MFWARNREGLHWHIAGRHTDIGKLREGRRKKAIQNRENRKASLHVKLEHLFRVSKRQFGWTKDCFRGLAKNTAHVITLFALSKL